MRAGTWVAIPLTVAFVLAAPLVQPPAILSVLMILFSALLFLIRGTKSVSISLAALAVLYAPGWLPLFALLQAVSVVVFAEVAFRAAPPGYHPYLLYLAGAVAGSLLAMLALGQWEPLIGLIGVTVATLLKSALKNRSDVLMVESLGVAMATWLFMDLAYQVPIRNLAFAAFIAFSFGYFAYRLRVADLSGLFSGALVGLILIVFADVRWFFVILIFLMVGAAATRYKFDYKTSLGAAESHGGVRGYVNVFSNLLVGTAAAVLFGLAGQVGSVAGQVMCTALFIGSVATAAGDTVAGEIGMTTSAPVLITTFEIVPRGTNGGVTLEGELAACFGSLSVAGAAYLLGMITLPLLGICTVAGLIGTNIDSLVGATLEDTGYIGNAGTNLIATMGGGLVALVLLALLL
ncbi:MAG: DUF92 domain-containing protein [Methanomicrobiales archaeon]|nr:DUF92 domain-containing protein [Methanomicrobiales archaeon]